MNKYLFWDFDGTLGGRIDGLRGRAWSMSMLEAIHQLQPECDLDVDDIDPFLHQGFPWHEPEKGHLDLNTPELWWGHLRKVFVRVFKQLGFPDEMAVQLAHLTQARFLDLNTWGLFADTLPVLNKLKSCGWKHIIVSNHVPELDMIVAHLGLTPYIDSVVNSAVVGYEKPHPKIFAAALARTDQPEQIWMIGDNIQADVFGAKRVGIEAILVRNIDPRAEYNFADLYEVERFLAG